MFQDKIKNFLNSVKGTAQNVVKQAPQALNTFSQTLGNAVQSVPQGFINQYSPSKSSIPQDILNIRNSPQVAQFNKWMDTPLNVSPQIERPLNKVFDFANTITQPAQQYGANQIAQPLLNAGSNYLKGNNLQAGVNLVQGVAAATPGAIGANMLSSVGISGSKAIRQGANPLTTAYNSFTKPTSFATEGLGVTNPYLAMGIDVLSAGGNPKQIASSIKSLKNIKGVAKAFSMDRNSLDELVSAEELLKNPMKYVDQRTTFANPVQREQAIEKAALNARETVERLAAKYLPNKAIERAGGDPLKIIKELGILHSQNKLGNVQMMGFASAEDAARVKPKSVIETAVGEKVITPQYDVPPSAVEIPQGRLAGLKNSETLKKIAGLKDQVVTPSRNVLTKMGEAGTEAANKVDNFYNNAERYTGGAVADYQNTIKTLGNNRIEKVLRSLDGQTVQLDEIEARAANELRNSLNTASQKAQGAKLEITRQDGTKVPFGPLKDYLPHIVDKDKLKTMREPTIRHFVDSGQMSVENAKTFVDDVISGKSVADAYERVFPGVYPSKFGNLEFSRILDWNKDVLRYDKKLLPDYFTGAYKRISNAEQFGPSNEGLTDILQRINTEGGNPKIAESILNRNLGLEKRNAGFDEGVSAMKQVQAASKLGLSAISNTGQSVNTATVYGVGPTLKAMIGARRPEAQDFALRSGAVLEDSLKSLDEKGISDGFLSKITAPGMGKVEKFNRVVAANAGKEFAENQFSKLVKNPNDKASRTALEKFGVNIDEALKSGRLSQDDLLKSAQMAVNTTQFKTRPIDLPPQWSSSWGRLLTQFKSFSFKQSDFLLNQVIKPAKGGNLKPLTRYVLLGLAAGEVIGDTKAFLRGRDRPTDPKERALDNLATVGGYGLMQDALSNFSRGSDSALQFITGPTLGDVAKGGSALAKVVTGDAKPLAKFALGNVPVVGQTIKNKVFPTNQAYKARTADTLTDTLLPTLLGVGAGMNLIVPGEGGEKFKTLVNSLKKPEVDKSTSTSKSQNLLSSLTADKKISPTDKVQIDATLKDLKAQREEVLTSESGLFRKGLTDAEKDYKVEEIDSQIKALSDAKKNDIDYSQISFTGQAEVDKALLSKKLGELTTSKNEVLKEFSSGKLSVDEANAKILDIKAQEKVLKASVPRSKSIKVKSVKFKKGTSLSRSKVRYSRPTPSLKLSELRYAKSDPIKFGGFKYKKPTFRYK